MASDTRRRGSGPSARERILEAAYELFRRDGTRAVGVDAVVKRSGVAKMTLYRHFRSKDELIVAFMDHREQVWRREFGQADALTRAATPADRLIALFDAHDLWFRSDDFDGPCFIRVLLEHPHDHASRQAAVRHLAKIRAYIAKDAAAAGVEDPESFAATLQIMLMGAIIARCGGDLDAALKAKEVAQLYVDAHAPREKASRPASTGQSQ